MKVPCEEISHSDLVKEISEIGEALNFVVKTEEPTPDNIYRLDVTWRDVEGHRPSKVFEVEVKGNVDLALARLAHVYDIWGVQQLWLIICDEKDSKRAMNLLEPRLKGSFAKIGRYIHVKTWYEIHELYSNIIKYKRLLKELSER